MDLQLVERDARVAKLADAWLDGRDDDVLRRLELAVAARRSYLQPALLSLWPALGWWPSRVQLPWF